MFDHEIIETIRATDRVSHLATSIDEFVARTAQPGDALGASVVDALLCGTRVVVREPVRETPLHCALVESMARSTTWKGEAR